MRREPGVSALQKGVLAFSLPLSVSPTLFSLTGLRGFLLPSIPTLLLPSTSAPLSLPPSSPPPLSLRPCFPPSLHEAWECITRPSALSHGVVEDTSLHLFYR